MNGIYHGRLVCDGFGNLLADEGSRSGDPVAYHEGSYVFIEDGEPSHNDRHHQQFAVVEGTVDESMTDDDSLVNVNEETNLHHFEVQPDDPHYDADAPNLTRLRHDPDKRAAKMTGHTDAYGEES